MYAVSIFYNQFKLINFQFYKRTELIDPFDVEAQKKIEAAIRQVGIFYMELFKFLASSRVLFD